MKKALLLLLFMSYGYIASAQITYSKIKSHKSKTVKHKRAPTSYKVVNPINTTARARITDTLQGIRMGTYGLIESPEVLVSPLSVIPGVETQVPERVMTRIKVKYGPALYDVKAIIDLTGQIVYIVRVVDKGKITQDYLDEYANSVVSPYLK